MSNSNSKSITFGGDTCPLCLDSIHNLLKTDCAHTFCESCITRGVLYDRRCPICRTSIQLGAPRGGFVVQVVIHPCVVIREFESFLQRTKYFRLQKSKCTP